MTSFERTPWLSLSHGGRKLQRFALSFKVSIKDDLHFDQSDNAQIYSYSSWGANLLWQFCYPLGIFSLMQFNKRLVFWSHWLLRQNYPIILSMFSLAATLYTTPGWSIDHRRASQSPPAISGKRHFVRLTTNGMCTVSLSLYVNWLQRSEKTSVHFRRFFIRFRCWNLLVLTLL